MKTLKKLNLLTLAISIWLPAHASFAQESTAPVMFSDCQNKIKIKSPDRGAGVYFSKNCEVAYVLPPAYGNVYAANPTLTSNASVCGSVQNVSQAIELSSQKVNRLLKRIEDTEKNIEYNELQDPWLDQGNSNDGKDETADQALEELEKLREQAMTQVEKILGFNEKLAQYEGPRVKLTISADHNQLVEEYQKLNKNILFRPMPLSKSTLTFIAKTDKNVGKAPAAIFWDVAGLKVTPEYFTGLKASDLDQPKESSTQSVLFSNGVSGQVVLSLVGACPFYDKSTGGMPEHIDAKQLSSYLATTADYVYNVQVNRAYIAKYNLAEMMKRIQKQTKKGGLFSSKTINSLVVDKDSKGWFQFQSLSEDSRHEWDEQLAQTIKAQLIARTLSQLGAVPVSASDVPGITPPGRSGASVIAEGLTKCPHIYCQAGAFVLTGLDAVFGSSKAVSEFIYSNDRWEIEEVRETKMVPQQGQVVFKD